MATQVIRAKVPDAHPGSQLGGTSPRFGVYVGMRKAELKMRLWRRHSMPSYTFITYIDNMCASHQ